ncbi:hypothetical protein EIP86_001985 [Pleurotus ostreatoroseus]|nr:hypothetical protein EIP86_001985 [Pleurotus ostreatoroseus]
MAGFKLLKHGFHAAIHDEVVGCMHRISGECDDGINFALEVQHTQDLDGRNQRLQRSPFVSTTKDVAFNECQRAKICRTPEDISDEVKCGGLLEMGEGETTQRLKTCRMEEQQEFIKPPQVLAALKMIWAREERR